MNTRSVLMVLVLLAVIVAGVLWYIWYGGYGSSQRTTTQLQSGPVITSETEQNLSSFASALQLEQQGNYASAIPQLQTALGSATSSVETAAILSHLEQDYEFTGRYADAIATYQQIAGTASFPSVVRAEAVEGMGLIYIRYSNATATAQIFSQAPYQSLYVATSSNKTMRNIFSYATTISPLPISEYYIAISYADAIINKQLLGQTSATATAQLSSLEQNASAHFQVGETALLTISQNPPTSVYMMNAQLARAIALGDLQEVGITDLGSADEAFQTALTDYAQAGLTESDGPARLQYAYFLVTMYGSSRASDIQNDLAPLYQDPTHRGQNITAILAQFAGAPTVGAKPVLARLSTIDPHFKAFLVSLGWTSSDFAATSTVNSIGQ